MSLILTWILYLRFLYEQTAFFVDLVSTTVDYFIDTSLYQIFFTIEFLQGVVLLLSYESTGNYPIITATVLNGIHFKNLDFHLTFSLSPTPEALFIA